MTPVSKTDPQWVALWRKWNRLIDAGRYEESEQVMAQIDVYGQTPADLKANEERAESAFLRQERNRCPEDCGDWVTHDPRD